MKTRKVLLELQGAQAAVKEVNFDAKKVVAVGNDKKVFVWNFSEQMPY